MEKIKIENLSYLKKREITRLKKLGIKTLKDCFYYFPNRYEDFSQILKIQMAKPEIIGTFQGKIKKIKEIFLPKKRVLTEIEFEDETGELLAIFYNQPFLKKILKIGDCVSFSGKVSEKGGKLFLQHPVFEKIPKIPFENLLHTGKIVPIYPETKGITSKWIRERLSKIIKNEIWRINEFLPQNILDSLNLMSLKDAILKIHFPKENREIDLARFRFAFEELFLLELQVLREKLKVKTKKAFPVKIHLELVKKFIQSLPFSLTESQKKETWRMLKEMEREVPMNRLLQGDVGSGKTLVATILALNCSKNGYQTAILAPTEILALQHYQRIFKTLEKFEQKIAIFTKDYFEFEGRKTKKEEILEKIKNGEIKIVIGTHSLFDEKVEFKKLALLVVDEQHKFGVKQRRKLMEKSQILPHFLSMTATPIPRTLALTLFGDLDLSILKELPCGKRDVEIEVLTPSQEKKAFEFIREKLKQGEQAFFVCPRIEFQEKGRLFSELKTVKEEGQRLKKIFPEAKIGILHGKMRSKELVLRMFEEKFLDILVATNVIEEGIDLPQVNILVIENAERFGLSQLYQLIGRIGRSGKKAFCFLISHLPTKNSAKRIEALLSSKNAFELAEKDLEIRGPGELLGEKQTGRLNLKVAKLTDLELIELAREKAKEILKKDPNLKKYPKLKIQLKRESKIYFL
ncbi:ATP-dependent DNA helicase RecG [Candidatus Parcubacteria bacterium]|nr:ATP-dependent DNA helicase RecG [Candidatus Parcubacteria bacterium]